MLFPFSKRSRPWEEKAVELRRLAETRPGELLDPWELAPKVGLFVVDDHHLADSGGWSGAVYPVPLPDGRKLCVLNPFHHYTRRKITLMEEICHIRLRHRPSKLVMEAGCLRVRDYNGNQEAEAYGIGAAALLPWADFFPRLNAGASVDCLAGEFDVSAKLIMYRINITGARNLYAARQRKGAGQDRGVHRARRARA